MTNNQSQSDKPRNKGIYILPNLFTTAGLFFGFYSIIHAFRGEFETSAIALFIAMIMDGLDGRVARLTNTESDFGKEYDSLCDVISFGLAPAIAIYFFAFENLGKLGWVVSFLFVASTALRLARFNTAAPDAEEKKYFQGLPCPSAAAVVGSFVWLSHNVNAPVWISQNIAIVLVIAVSLSMVSNINYYSFKDINLKGRMSFIGLFMIVIVFIFIALNPALVLFILFFTYFIAGPLSHIPFIKKKLDQVPSVSDALDIDDTNKD